METMTVGYEPRKGVTCYPETIHVPRFSTEDILLTLDDAIVDKYDFPDDAIRFKNKAYAKRFKWFHLNKKTLWLHDDNTPFHKNEENARFTVTIRDPKGAKKSLDPRVVNN